MSTLSELQTEVAEEIGSINVTDDATKINRFLNRAVRDFLVKTGVKVASATMTTTADVGDYTLSADILAIKNMGITSGSVDYDLERVSPQEIIDLRRTSSTSRSPSRYYALNGSDMLMLYPTPASADTLELYYVPKPTEMSSASHDPASATYGGIPEEFHDAIALYAMWKLASFDDDQSSAQGQRYRDDYTQRVKDCKRALFSKGNVVLPRARVGNRRSVPHDNSSDF